VNLSGSGLLLASDMPNGRSDGTMFYQLVMADAEGLREGQGDFLTVRIT
jgi:hypothetical protein